MLEVALHNPRQHKQFRREDGAIVLARADRDSAIWTPVERGSKLADALVEIVHQSDGVSLAMAGCEAESDCGRHCGLTGNCRLPLPVSFTIGDTRFEISSADCNASRRTLQRLRKEKYPSTNDKSSVAGPSPATLSRWFAALSSLNHWATSLQELYVQAARCAVEAIGLNGGIVFRHRDQQWEIAASYLPHPELGIHCDAAALDDLTTTTETLFHGGDGDATTLGDEPAVVLSPLRNASGELVGALYGYRSVRAGNARRTIRYLEAHMVELLAGAVSEGIARIERDAETNRRRVLLEQAVAASPTQLLRKTRTEQREVTLLFTDLRNSTELSTALQADESFELMNQVVECLSAAVIDHDGLIIDFYGDGLAAMWNAPADQTDHAELACRAALRMLQTLPGISDDWMNVTHRELQLGIGIHTGVAHVGNTGSRRRAKYGPRGTNVNLTSRIEAATKQLGLPLLASEATAQRLSNRFAAHRVCRVKLSGFSRPIELFNVCQPNSDDRLTATWQAYHDALRNFERGQLNEALDSLSAIENPTTQIPARFLIDCVKAELSSKHRRRSTDRVTSASRGVVMLDAK
ncbi:MAG TPA: adenylate/guanylate cyclase domain-containing protein [Lacipirellulaceae bacterium]|nr:adenylate/guanylate cyclase domain-containing protein [Lacipirellulaceae bacterium]